MLGKVAVFSSLRGERRGNSGVSGSGGVNDGRVGRGGDVNGNNGISGGGVSIVGVNWDGTREISFVLNFRASEYLFFVLPSPRFQTSFLFLQNSYPRPRPTLICQNSNVTPHLFSNIDPLPLYSLSFAKEQVRP